MTVSSAGITIRSGRVAGTKKIKEAVQRAKDRAVLLGVSSTLAKLLNAVAFKSGKLSREVKTSYDNQITQQKGLDEITIKFDRGHIRAEVKNEKGFSYGILHVNPGGEFISYQSPTPGTKPIEEFEWNEMVANEIEAIIPGEMIKEGLVVSQLL
ncbi:hypothetical protein LCGC14_1935020 [marine sediment metagenome]|uniref:Uncharacterized protein n=1 Tax=marine sediment metagenome TaxID=412755 RepID=A0A0F9FLZ6_9ZZZZ